MQSDKGNLGVGVHLNLKDGTTGMLDHPSRKDGQGSVFDAGAFADMAWRASSIFLDGGNLTEREKIALQHKNKMDEIAAKLTGASKASPVTKQEQSNMEQRLIDLGVDKKSAHIVAADAAIHLKKQIRKNGNVHDTMQGILRVIQDATKTESGFLGDSKTLDPNKVDFDRGVNTSAKQGAKADSPTRSKNARFWGDGQKDATKAAKPKNEKPPAKKSSSAQKGIGITPSIAKPKGVSTGTFNQIIENIKNGAKGYTDGVALTEKVMEENGPFSDLSAKQKRDVLYYSEHRRLPKGAA